MGVIVHSDLLLDYLKNQFPEFYFVSSTTKVLTDFWDFRSELKQADFSYVVPDCCAGRSLFRRNVRFVLVGFFVGEGNNLCKTNV